MSVPKVQIVQRVDIICQEVDIVRLPLLSCFTVYWDPVSSYSLRCICWGMLTHLFHLRFSL